MSKLRIWILLAAFIALSAQALVQPDTSAVGTVDWNNTGTKIAAGQHYGLLGISDGSTGQLLQSFQLPNVKNVKEVAWSPYDSDLLAVSASGVDGPGTMYILDTATGQTLLTVTGGDWIPAISWSPDGSRIVGSIGYTANPYANRYLEIWDASTGQLLDTITPPKNVYAVAWSPDGSQLVLGGYGGIVQIVQLPIAAPQVLSPTADAGAD